MSIDDTRLAGLEVRVKEILHLIGEDIERPGLLETPKRVAKSYREIFGGYSIDPASVMTTFKAEDADEMIILKDIEFYSTCEHHMLPFHGKAHIAYIPHGRILGISKLARLLEIYSRRLQIQERICTQITASLDEHLRPLGSACILEAQHFCMVCRGVGKQNSSMITSSLTGEFKDDSNTRQELLSLIKG